MRGGDRVRVSAVGAITSSVDDLDDGTYRISWSGDESGVHTLMITFGPTEHIKGSPLSVLCEPGR